MPCAGAKAQDQQPQGPVYIIQEGDSLWEIAQRFGVSVDDLYKRTGCRIRTSSGWDFARDSGIIRDARCADHTNGAVWRDFTQY